MTCCVAIDVVLSYELYLRAYGKGVIDFPFCARSTDKLVVECQPTKVEGDDEDRCNICHSYYYGDKCMDGTHVNSTYTGYRCAPRTDCRLCGPITEDINEMCLDLCATSGNGLCEDGAPGSVSTLCAYGEKPQAQYDTI
jgi:hypothetical protein